VTASVEQRDIRECHPSRAALRFQRTRPVRSGLSKGIREKPVGDAPCRMPL